MVLKLTLKMVVTTGKRTEELQEEELLQMIADIGYVIEKHLRDPVVAGALIILAWVLMPTPFAELMLSILIVSMYYRYKRGKEPVLQPGKVSEELISDVEKAPSNLLR